MADIDEGIRGFMHLRCMLTTIVITGALLLVSGAICLGMIIVSKTIPAFEQRVPLPNQHSLVIGKRPACTWYTPEINACYQDEVHPHSEVSLIYETAITRRVLVSFELANR
jgi:hypothetical protein